MWVTTYNFHVKTETKDDQFWVNYINIKKRFKKIKFNANRQKEKKKKNNTHSFFVRLEELLLLSLSSLRIFVLHAPFITQPHLYNNIFLIVNNVFYYNK